MKINSRTCVAALTSSFVLFGSVLLAQTAGPEAGLIGKRYAGADFGYDHFTGSALDQSMSAIAVANLPLSRAIDLGLGYSYTDTTGSNFGAIDKSFSASLLTHRQSQYGNAYFAATLGHTWNDASAFGIDTEDNGAFWAVRAGYEIPIATRTAVNAGLGFVDTFRRGSTRVQALRYYVEGNHWFSRDVAGVLSVCYRQINHSADAVSYTAGLRWAF